MLHNRKLLAVIITGILLVALPIFIVIVQRSQENRSNASAATTLSLQIVPSPTKPTIMVNDPISVIMKANPGNTNLLSVISFVITYDTTKVKPGTTPFVLNPALSGWKSVVPAQVNTTTGTISGSYSVGADPTQAIQKSTDIGTFSFTAISGTDGQTTSVGFQNSTTVYSLSSKDTAQENVLTATTPAAFSIVSIPVPTAIPSPTPTPVVTTYYLKPSESTITFKVSNANSYYNVYAVLYKKSTTVTIPDSVITNQSDFSYQWSIDNTTVATGEPQSICIQGVQAPCPYGHYSIKGKTPGNAKATVMVTQISTGKVIASTSYAMTVIPRETPTPIPTVIPTVIPTTIPTPVVQPSYIAIILGLHGIGYAGDNANPGKIVSFSPSNPAPAGEGDPRPPLHTSRQASLQFYNGQNILLYTIPVPVTFSPDTFSFGSIFPLSSDAVSVLAGKTVSIRVSVPQYLTHVYPLVTIKNGETTNLSYVPLITGNVYNDSTNQNQLDILDYNAIMDCREDVDTVNKMSACSVTADINDDGHVDVKDYQLLIRELSVQSGR